MLFHVYDDPKPEGYYLFEPEGIYRTILDADWLLYLLLPLLLVLLAGGIAATWGMAKCHEPIARDLESAAKTALQGDMVQGESLMLQARDAWGRSRHLGACFADHTPMEEIDALFAEVEVYAAAREETDFAAGCAALSRKVEAMGQAHGASWWNLF